MGHILRLRARADFQNVFHSGRSWAHRLLVLVAQPNGLPATRVGVVAGKRVGNAVVRNRTKRLMREAVREQAAHIPPGWDLVLIARAAMAPVKMESVAEALESLLRQAKVYR